MDKSNRYKSQAGYATRNSLAELLKELYEEYSEFFGFEMNYSTGVAGKNPTQFFMNARIIFKNDNETWFIRTSSSFRSDRIKGNEFEAEYIKQLYPLNLQVRFLFAVPDTINDKERKNFRKYASNISAQTIVTNFDAAVTYSGLRQLIINKCLEHISSGKRSNIIGTSSESYIARVFNDVKNIMYWNDHNLLIKTSTFATFQSILLSMFDVNMKIDSTKGMTKVDLPDLRTIVGGGHPKTDAIIIITFEDNTEEVLKLSIKQPSLGNNRSITVHQGYVEDLLKDLEPVLKQGRFSTKYFEELQTSLLHLQECAGIKKLESKYPVCYKFLEDNLSKINEYLIKYFIFGIYNSRLSPNQIANLYVKIESETGNVSAHTVDETISEMLNFKGQFGTPFSWTSPSGKGGKQIQIKAPIL